MRYLSGFTGSNAALLVAADGDDLLATDGRYTEQAAAESPDIEVLVARHCALALVESVGGGGGRVAFEAHHVTVEATTAWRRGRSPIELVRLGHVVEDLRRVKDDDELDLLREACAVGDRALAELLPWLAVGRTERQVARRLEGLMLDLGGDGLSFDTIVASRPELLDPAPPAHRSAVARGDFLKLDFGAEVSGLPRRHDADAGRSVTAADWQRETLRPRGDRSQARPGGRGGRAVEVAGVDRAARSVIEDAGLGERFPHGLGHGVGLEIHEDPFLAASSTGTLEAGIPVTVEPGVYHPGRGGVRIEDTLVVTHGVPELLTTTTKELLVVGTEVSAPTGEPVTHARRRTSWPARTT